MSKATLYVWLPTGLYPAGLGHAALQIQSATGREYYITWLAAGKGPAKACFPSSNGMVSKQVKNWTFEKDKNVMADWGMREPNRTIELPTLFLQQRGKGMMRSLHHGVDVEEIVEFWDIRKVTMTSYTLMSTKENCTGCVVEALRAGGLDSYLKNPNNWFIQDARTLWTWANDAVERIKLANERQQKIEVMMEQLILKHGAWATQMQMHTNPTIPSLQEWKTESDQNIKYRAVARRIDQVKRLDELIEEYHKNNDPLTRLRCVVQMLIQINLHLVQKPNSDRRLAVERLGVRTYFVFCDLLSPGNYASADLEDVRRVKFEKVTFRDYLLSAVMNDKGEPF
jgi:hypothetical protein